METLIHRFFEGETTKEEEQELYRFFERRDVPESLLPYKELFRYFEDGIRRDAPSIETSFAWRKRRRIAWISIAASFALLVASVPVFLQKGDAPGPYEGSYIIRNGVRITDKEIIRKELDFVMQDALKQQEEADLFCRKVRQQYDDIINQFPDEYARTRVREILFETK
jgi:hypothetical protein